MSSRQHSRSRRASSPRARAPKPNTRKAWYSLADIHAIAQAIGAGFPDEKIGENVALLESAADWYWRACNEPERLNPSLTRKELQQIVAAACRLLRHLGVRNVAQAVDGPPDNRIIDALVNTTGGSEDDVVRATGRIGRLLEIVKGIEAVKELERRSSAAAEDKDLELLVPKGHVGDLALSAWITDLMQAYEEITGKRASYGSSDTETGGPFIRFLVAAGAPLDISRSPEEWRNRVRYLDRQK